MLAFHNEHIASCAFLTYFAPDSTTASTSPTALTTAAAATILNDKQALTGILMKPKLYTNLMNRRQHPYDCEKYHGNQNQILNKNLKSPQVIPHQPFRLYQPCRTSLHHHHHILPNYRMVNALKKNHYRISTAVEKPSIMLNVNNPCNPKISCLDEQHQYVFNRNSLTTSTSSTTTTTTTTLTSAMTTSSLAVPETATKKQHQYYNDYVHLQTNLSQL
ncbi:uncharacterized protein LOC142235321 [Haematobia irritans]|uniref:uncharacterized protein LOC142235321 n=1 Tax=Haematobia irritans TaxID=7368 RepID=UPI003F50C957